MNTSQSVPLGCLQLRWRDPSHTARNIADAAKLLACGASRRPDRMTDVQLDGPHGVLRVEPVEWSRRCWHVCVTLQWPPGRDSALWSRVLLDANTELMRQGAMAFAADDDNTPMLMGRVYAGAGRERDIERQLLALLEVCAAIDSVVQVEGTAQVAYDALPAFIAPHRRDEPANDAPSLIEMLIEAGLPQQQACYVAASGQLPMGDGDVRVESTDGGRALLLSAHLGHALLDGEAVLALSTNAHLMREHGLALAHSAAGHRLVAHWPCGGRPPGEFEDCLLALAGLPATLQDARSVRDPVDTDFSSLAPL
jgi:hypothetical protein